MTIRRMTIRHLPSVLIALALVAGTAPVTAQAQSESAVVSTVAQKKQKKIKRQRVTHQIACTVYGCQRIPPRCHPEQGYNWDGIPTGYDIIVCR